MSPVEMRTGGPGKAAKRLRRWVAVLPAVMLVTGACGSRMERTAIQAAERGGLTVAAGHESAGGATTAGAAGTAAGAPSGSAVGSAKTATASGTAAAPSGTKAAAGAPAAG